MIKKRNGNGHSECDACKLKGKFALKWDSWLYDYNNKVYCFDCLMEELENLGQENEYLKADLKLHAGALNRNHLLTHKCNDLEDQNKELKQQLQVKDDNFKIVKEKLCKYIEENESLKKQLKEKTRIGVADYKYASKCEDKVITMENQQKEFLNYLEKEINIYKNIYKNDILNLLKNCKLYYFLIKNLEISNKKLEEILAKYKEIIGVENKKATNK